MVTHGEIFPHLKVVHFLVGIYVGLLFDLGSSLWLTIGTAVGRLLFQLLVHGSSGGYGHWNCSCPTAVPTVSVELLSETAVRMVGWALEPQSNDCGPNL